MDISSQRNLKDFADRRSGPHDGRQHSPCAGCQTLDCHSIHGTDTQTAECPLSGCYLCADLPRIDDEIASIYQRLSDLVKERQQIITTKPRHDTIIHRMPVEILSMIFIFVKDAIINFTSVECPDHVVPKPPYEQPSQSPPLLIGAVCKRWRDITLTTPQLWTDILINLLKCAEGQLNMVKKWAHRSAALPLDITIFLYQGNRKRKNKVLEEYEDVLSALRSLAARWNGIALLVPAFFCYGLLDNLKEAPPINTLFFTNVYGNLKQIKLQHPLRPTRLLSNRFYGRDIPCEWDRLVFVKIDEVDNDEILHIIRHAQNLRHCIGGTVDNFESGEFPIPTVPITNRSLIYLETSSNIIHHLTLPSLLHLDYRASEPVDMCIDTFVEFIKRSCAPLDNFTFRCCIYPWDPFPRLERAREITSLFFDVFDKQETPDSPKIDDFLHALSRRPSPDAILPRLRKISFELRDLSASSWLLLSRLFRKDSQSNLADIPVNSNTAMTIPLKKPVSQGRVPSDDLEAAINSDTFLRLSEAKKSGVDITIVDYCGRDLLVI